MAEKFAKNEALFANQMTFANLIVQMLIEFIQLVQRCQQSLLEK